MLSPSPTSADAEKPYLFRQNDHGIVRLSLNRPRSINTLSVPMIAVLQSALDDAIEETATKAIIIDGGDRGFCAGHDLKEINSHRTDEDGGRDFFEALFASCTAMMMTIRKAPVPVIAMVDGIATAAGCQLVATCDLAIASDRSKFGVNGVDAGLFCSTPMVALSRDIPQKAAMEMLVAGKMIAAERALSLGLVNHTVPHEELEADTLDLARRIAKRSKSVISLGKKAFYEQATMDLEAAYNHASKVIVDNLMMEDAVEGIDAFISKRTPSWPSETE